MGYAKGETLRNYLKEKFHIMDWQDKCSLAMELTCAIVSMHNEGIIHEDLNSNSILVVRDSIRIIDFGLSRRFKDQSLYDTLPYDAPERFNIISENLHSPEQIEKLKKCNVYSIGVLLWELTSGKRPFSDREYNENLADEITRGLRESIVEGTSEVYSNVYISKLFILMIN